MALKLSWMKDRANPELPAEAVTHFERCLENQAETKRLNEAHGLEVLTPLATADLFNISAAGDT